MDRRRFDSLSLSLMTVGSRRRALVATIGGALGLLDFAVTEAGGACKPACFDCQTCKKINGKQHCTKGKCLPKPDSTPCVGGTCQSGTCVEPFPSPAPPPPYCAGRNFCPIATTPPTCQASGAQCVCAAKDGGEPVCVLYESLHFESICSLCATGESCLDATGCVGKIKACALPCPNPI